MEKLCPFEISVKFYHTTRRYTPEDTRVIKKYLRFRLGLQKVQDNLMADGNIELCEMTCRYMYTAQHEIRRTE
jgi:hypothetical protein